MADDLISVVDLANQHGRRRQTIFKVLKRLGIDPEKRRSIGSHGQTMAYVTREESHRVATELLSARTTTGVEADTDLVPEALLAEQGVFYLLLLEPDHDPGRFKVGFATSLPERLRQLRCSAPLAKVIRTWPCKRLWEKTAIECVANDCERLHTEVFRTVSIESVLKRCERFFELMPDLARDGRTS